MDDSSDPRGSKPDSRNFFLIVYESWIVIAGNVVANTRKKSCGPLDELQVGLRTPTSIWTVPIDEAFKTSHTP